MLIVSVLGLLEGVVRRSNGVEAKDAKGLLFLGMLSFVTLFLLLVSQRCYSLIVFLFLLLEGRIFLVHRRRRRQALFLPPCHFLRR